MSGSPAAVLLVDGSDLDHSTKSKSYRPEDLRPGYMIAPGCMPRESGESLLRSLHHLSLRGSPSDLLHLHMIESHLPAKNTLSCGGILQSNKLFLDTAFNPNVKVEPRNPVALESPMGVKRWTSAKPNHLSAIGACNNRGVFGTKLAFKYTRLLERSI